MAAVSDRAEVDTARPFRSVKEAVAVFGDRILVGKSHSRPIANANAIAIATPSAKHEASSSSSTITLSPNAMAESEAEAMAAVVPMYSAPSSPPSLASSPSPSKEDGKRHYGRDDEAGLVIMRSIEKLEAEVADTRQEVAQLRKRGSEMEMAVASLNAQLHRGLSKLAEMEADKAASATGRRSIGGDTDVASTVRSERYWGDKLGAHEYLPSFSHALSLGEVDDDELISGRRRKAQKVKPIVPLIGDILFSKRKSTKDKGDDGFYSGDLYSVLG
ncbi:uncharacterized protein LOC133887010 [Phragmites australis]|uniref:uncharacterized protein LOC133887010 n=1 Tax=Phragmites australis TaxID=29695 RepID=UPI002D79F627|nr:uncharacterized protein LOC133887010 [Phragmites australis]